ncbi:unnamed protein product [Cylindrotheca closterium]|uniref:Uncharacterized protein n=1 Tax=Cylindrotheca closterium TaxID=2856 RepID=A0AAD2JMJ8_9STRA|nr:unnamed protein product [Cylindrotheca closterium]
MKPGVVVKENSFLRAFRLHRSGIRFLGAGLYCDAIHTLMHGLELLHFSADDEDKNSFDNVSVKFARWKQLESASASGRIQHPSEIQVNKTPMDHTCYTNEEWMTPMLKPCCNRCRGSLVGAMLYNMALAYHLHAITFEQDGNRLYSYLNQASSLYSAAEGILQKYNVSIRSSLETNERHIHYLICSRPVPESALFSLHSSSSSLNVEANFGSILQQRQPNETGLNATICSLAQSNGMAADFGH